MMNELKVPLGENSILFIWQHKLSLRICPTGPFIAWFTDNQNVPSINNEPEQTLALKLFQICLQHRISLDVKWVPREANHPADKISKIVNFDDYTINDQVFAELDIKWGPHTVDRFTCFYNTKLPRFNSRFYQTGTEGVDAFTQD